MGFETPRQDATSLVVRSGDVAENRLSLSVLIGYIWIPSISKGWAESRSKFGRRDLDPAWLLVHAEHVCHQEIILTNQNQSS